MRRGGDTGPQAASSPGGERIYSPPGTEDDITGTVCRTVLRSGAVTNFYETRRKKGNCAPRFQRRPCPRRPRAPLRRRFPPPALRLGRDCPHPLCPPTQKPPPPFARMHTHTASISSTPYRLRKQPICVASLTGRIARTRKFSGSLARARSFCPLSCCQAQNPDRVRPASQSSTFESTPPAPGPRGATRAARGSNWLKRSPGPPQPSSGGLDM